MADIHTGAWGLPDFGISEWVSDRLGKSRTSQGGSNLVGGSKVVAPAPAPQPAPAGEVKGASTTTNSGAKKTTTTSNTKQNTPAPQQSSNSQNSSQEVNNSIDDAAAAKEEAARRAAEAKRQSAMNAYKGKVDASARAKDQARGQYDWLINTLGSNKQDLLEQVNYNEQQGVQTYADQEEKTKATYDKSRQEILSTYRDLGKDQEKIMRGSGMSTSSRSQEAQLRLNNLLGKDISTVSTNEADSLAMIGNAVSALKEKSLMSKNSIEREATSKLDKASLDYKGQVSAIDSNTTLSEYEREDAYAAAEAKLAEDSANIQSWAAGLKLQQQQAEVKMKELLNSYIVDMTDANTLLNSDLTTKEDVTSQMLSNAGYTPLDQELGADQVASSVYRSSKKYSSQDELEQALRNGQISELEYNQQIDNLQKSNVAGGLNLASTPASTGTMTAGSAQKNRILAQDPLLAAMMA